jgi:hypothetical protein
MKRWNQQGGVLVYMAGQSLKGWSFQAPLR